MTSFSIPTMTPNAASIALSAVTENKWRNATALPVVLGPLWCLAWASYAGWIGTLSGFVLLAVLVTSAITDIRKHRIYNWVTYTAFLWAVAINLAATLLSTGDDTLYQLWHRATVGPDLLGAIGIGPSLAGAGLCFVVTLAGYHLSGGGAGDVKLATVIGALLGVYQGLFAVGYSYVIAAVAIVAWSVYCNGPWALVKAAFRTVGSWVGPRWWPFPPSADDSKLMLKPIPLGPYFFLGTLLVMLELVPTC